MLKQKQIQGRHHRREEAPQISDETLENYYACARRLGELSADEEAMLDEIDDVLASNQEFIEAA